jgi:hypothetical protein
MLGKTVTSSNSRKPGSFRNVNWTTVLGPDATTVNVPYTKPEAAGFVALSTVVPPNDAEKNEGVPPSNRRA